MNKQLTWENQKQIGDAGEAKIRSLMAARGHEVINLANNPTYWEKDIDMLVAGHPIEVKTDNVMYRTGNLFIEEGTYFNTGEYHAGWVKYTEAEYLFYLDNMNEILYIYNMDDVKEKAKHYQIGTLRFPHKRVDGYLMPIGGLPHQTIKLKEASEWQKVEAS